MAQMKQRVARYTCDGTAKQRISVITCNLLTSNNQHDETDETEGLQYYSETKNQCYHV